MQGAPSDSTPRQTDDAQATRPVIAIDGPAGAGKSTAARMLARRLGFLLLDTGAIYRSLALLADERGIAPDDAPALAALAASLDISFAPAPSGEGQIVRLAGRDVSEVIRTPPISDIASQVSSLPEVRQALLALQRDLGKRGGYVVEGRDIGSVVLPWAPLKFFLTASPAERARRRHEELTARGVHSDLEATLAEIIERDRRDETRAVAPLIRAPDALLIDTSHLSLDEVVDRMESIARERLGAAFLLDAPKDSV
ncbi:MAG TPA: (d)CMP kinase [Polyangia bacterium]|jgi:cytidylate kinase|nr:(d)CMP kinase [Polyangia bacterium]